MGILIAILVFGIIVTVHEFGHFICAKLSGIKVLEFSVGMGPKLLQKVKGETKYSLRLLPVGGYCAMEGEDSTNNDPRSFRNAKLWKRMLVLVAGAAMNFVLGFVMLLILVSMMDAVPTTKIENFGRIIAEDGSETYTAQSYKTGLRIGDKLVSIDGTRVYSTLDLDYIFDTISPSEGHKVVVKRDGERLTLNDVFFHNDVENGKMVDFAVIYKDKSPLSVIKGAGDIFMSMSHIVGLSLKQMLTGQMHKEDVAGPVGVVTAISEQTQNNESVLDAIFKVVYMTALITINVGIFNLLPIPGLDGGRLLFCFIELIRRKPVKPEHEGYVHLAGMVLLFGVMIFATYNDIARLITGG